MRGTDLVLLVSILLGCSWWYSNGVGVKSGWRHKYQQVMNELIELRASHEKSIANYKGLEKRVQKMEKQQCQRVQCPTGYIQYSGSCFRFVMGRDNVQDWYGARRFCEGQGANMVTIDSRKKESLIGRYIKNNFGNQHEVDIYTGLIYTDVNARNPFSMGHPCAAGCSGGFTLWTATREAVKTAENMGVEGNNLSYSRWSPKKIDGLAKGPGIGNFHSCVVIRWKPDSKSKPFFHLTWRYYVCTEKLAFVCEIRMKRPKCNKGHRRKKKRPKRDAESEAEEEDEEEEEFELEIENSYSFPYLEDFEFDDFDDDIDGD